MHSSRSCHWQCISDRTAPCLLSWELGYLFLMSSAFLQTSGSLGSCKKHPIAPFLSLCTGVLPFRADRTIYFPQWKQPKSRLREMKVKWIILENTVWQLVKIFQVNLVNNGHRSQGNTFLPSSGKVAWKVPCSLRLFIHRVVIVAFFEAWNCVIPTENLILSPFLIPTPTSGCWNL